MHDPVEIII